MSAADFFVIAEKLLDHRNDLRAFFILLFYDSSLCAFDGKITLFV